MLIPRVTGPLTAFAPAWSIDRLFEDFFAGDPDRVPSTGVFPAWNVFEDEKSFLVEAEVPGFSKEGLEISVVGDELRLSGAREPRVDEKANVHRRERFVGKFSRALRFGVPIDAQKVEARFANGVLTVTLPKSEAALPRKIRVQGV